MILFLEICPFIRFSSQKWSNLGVVQCTQYFKSLKVFIPYYWHYTQNILLLANVRVRIFIRIRNGLIGRIKFRTKSFGSATLPKIVLHCFHLLWKTAELFLPWFLWYQFVSNFLTSLAWFCRIFFSLNIPNLNLARPICPFFLDQIKIWDYWLQRYLDRALF